MYGRESTELVSIWFVFQFFFALYLHGLYFCFSFHRLSRRNLCLSPTNTRREENVSSTFPRKKIGYSKESNDQQDQFNSELTLHFGIAAKTNLLLLFPTRYAHGRYSSRMIDRFLNWGDHGKPKSGKIKGRCQPPLDKTVKMYINSYQIFTPHKKLCLCCFLTVSCPHSLRTADVSPRSHHR